jgi:hypothetical protein
MWFDQTNWVEGLMRTICILLLLLSPRAFGQGKQPTIPAKRRAEHCKLNPTDTHNCIKVQTTTELLGLPKVCPDDSSDTPWDVISLSFQSLFGIDGETFEEAGLCHSTEEGRTALVRALIDFKQNKTLGPR